MFRICVILITFLDVLVFGVSRVNYVNLCASFFRQLCFTVSSFTCKRRQLASET